MEIPSFRIDRAPVTNGEFAGVLDGRGYRISTDTGATRLGVARAREA